MGVLRVLLGDADFGSLGSSLALDGEKQECGRSQQRRVYRVFTGPSYREQNVCQKKKKTSLIHVKSLINYGLSLSYFFWSSLVGLFNMDHEVTTPS